ncbi:helicase-associated domain-containing protein [Streptomyces olivochromogenes]|uniref:helicase-associated domain-containing protein n=1 Tax=Streptomyces olivochromogenes TaxID=1963 RepID=UPI001F2BD8CB|nr:helicase-associated domain-containing protein [Streptomyces olivochromogenes]MCF3135875.1 helicase-associated domain-containing protein [Streptomyces olivochromogenes]
MLDAFATRSADHVWTLSAASLLKALHAGRRLKEVRRFLAESSTGEELSQTVTALLADAASRTEKVRDLGAYHLLGCVDEARAVMIDKDRRTGVLCSQIGQKHLMVAPGDLSAFRAALLKLGCVPPAPR